LNRFLDVRIFGRVRPAGPVGNAALGSGRSGDNQGSHRDCRAHGTSIQGRMLRLGGPSFGTPRVRVTLLYWMRVPVLVGKSAID
jgi:hypothetical protein